MYDEEHGGARKWAQHHTHTAAHILIWDGTGVGAAMGTTRRANVGTRSADGAAVRCGHAQNVVTGAVERVRSDAQRVANGAMVNEDGPCDAPGAQPAVQNALTEHAGGHGQEDAEDGVPARHDAARAVEDTMHDAGVGQAVAICDGTSGGTATGAPHAHGGAQRRSTKRAGVAGGDTHGGRPEHRQQHQRGKRGGVAHEGGGGGSDSGADGVAGDDVTRKRRRQWIVTDEGRAKAAEATYLCTETNACIERNDSAVTGVSVGAGDSDVEETTEAEYKRGVKRKRGRSVE